MVNLAIAGRRTACAQSTQKNEPIRVANLCFPKRPLLAALLLVAALAAPAAPVHLVEQSPVQITTLASGAKLVDFGRVAFGNLRLIPPTDATNLISVHFGEALANGAVNCHPPGSVRYARQQALLNGKSVIIAPNRDQRNTAQPAAVLTPPDWGVVLPFRWVEIDNWPGELHLAQISRRAAFATTWNDQAADFQCSDETLNHIWELCRYSIKATTFAGVYVDGDRERISYEADAYLNQLGQYYTDGDIQMARDTFDRLVRQPTWPTEWASHMIFMAYADWRQTGDTNWLAPRFATLQSKLLPHTRADGLVVSNPSQRGDLVDWPDGERDGFVFTPINTVINAFHLRTLAMMAELARALHRDADAVNYAAKEQTARAAFQAKLFDPQLGLYRDGEGTPHTSLHANLFPLAFDLVPAESRAHVAGWLGDRGMRCSVYAAQYLLEALFENDRAAQALQLMTAPNDRSWKHMLDSGTTITWEAWDQRYKSNLDWNHAWGSAPANLLPRFVLGVQPLQPGWSRVAIHPQPDSLAWVKGKVPTPLGSLLLQWDKGQNTLKLTLPPGMTSQVQLPGLETKRVFVNGKSVATHLDNHGLLLDKDVAGTVEIKVR